MRSNSSSLWSAVGQGAELPLLRHGSASLEHFADSEEKDLQAADLRFVPKTSIFYFRHKQAEAVPGKYRFEKPPMRMYRAFWFPDLNPPYPGCLNPPACPACHNAPLRHCWATQLEVPIQRLEKADAGLQQVFHDVRRRGGRDDTFVDALCDPPETFTFGGVFAHIMTFNAHRRLMALDALRQLGVKTEGFGDPIEYEQSVAPWNEHSPAK